MDKLKKMLDYCKEHPYEVGFCAVTAFFILQTLNAKRLTSITNYQNDVIDKANDNFEMILEAIRNGWEMVIDEERKILDIIPTESQAIQA